MNRSFYLLPLLLASVAFAEEKKSAEPLINKLLCHGPHEERTLEIQAKGSGCVLMYTKQNNASEVARAQYDHKPCRAAMQKIRDRLESGNFACE